MKHFTKMIKTAKLEPEAVGQLEEKVDQISISS
jgi:hypothetical protein